MRNAMANTTVFVQKENMFVVDGKKRRKIK